MLGGRGAGAAGVAVAVHSYTKCGQPYTEYDHYYTKYGQNLDSGGVNTDSKRSGLPPSYRLRAKRGQLKIFQGLLLGSQGHDCLLCAIFLIP